MRTLRLGTRGSLLAMAQATSVAQKLAEAATDLNVEVVPIKTSGDKGRREVVGAFVREIQDAILRGDVDAGLHCFKDLPVEVVPGLCFAAHLQREDPHDALISRHGDLKSLPEGALVGTGSLRRTAQLSVSRPDLRFRPIVGNIDTRLEKLLSGEYDAIVLAIAGLSRLGVLEVWKGGPYRELSVQILDMALVLPAAGQAVLVLETRESDELARSSLSRLHHEPTALEATAERVFLKGFGGGCSLPVAARASVSGDSIRLEGLVASPDGSVVLRDSEEGRANEGGALATRLVERLASRGAKELLGTLEAVL